jgi:hypothetical protein
MLTTEMRLMKYLALYVNSCARTLAGTVMAGLSFVPSLTRIDVV